MAKLKIYSWNVNGIRAVVRKDLLEPFLAKHDPDILCLQETKAMRQQAQIDLPQYHEYWNSAEKKGYSGTAIFTKTKPIAASNDFTDEVNARYDLTDDQERDGASEGRVVTAEYEQFYVVSVYTPNAKDDLSRLNFRHLSWDPAFLEYCKALEKKKPVIFCGDLNVAHTEDDLARPKENIGKKGFTEQEREGFEKFIESGFVDTFRMFTSGNGHYSWWSYFAQARARNIGWRIDYVLVSSSLKDKIKAAEIHPDVMGSDHCPVSITLDI